MTLCEWCGGDAVDGSVCPKSQRCPTCSAEPGSRCRRPSGHLADTLHASRIAAAERLDHELALSVEPGRFEGSL